LSSGSFYNVRAYAVNKVGTSYGDIIVFRTAEIPQIATSLVSNITDSSAQCGGLIVQNGRAEITASGICWSINTYPTIFDDSTAENFKDGNFLSYLSGLKSGTTYYVRAYATNKVGTNYGQTRVFNTLNSVEIRSLEMPRITYEVRKVSQYVSPTSSNTQIDTVQISVECTINPADANITNEEFVYSAEHLYFSFENSFAQAEGNIHFDQISKTLEFEYNYDSEFETINLVFVDLKYTKLSNGQILVNVDYNRLSEYLEQSSYSYSKINFFGVESSSVTKTGLKVIGYENNNLILNIKNKFIY